MRADVLAHLRCPVCAGGLTATGRAVTCGRGHSFDVARQGYLNLAAGPVRHPGDTPAMVAARAEFLAAGYYDFIAEALAGAVPGVDGLVVDVGAGTGFHLAAVLHAAPRAVGLALDSSKAAVRRAARAHPRAAAAVCDAWQRLPVADGAAALVLDVFAPRNAAEFRRILSPAGTLLVVTPEPEHLRELVDAAGLLQVDPSKEDRLLQTLGPPSSSRVLTRRLRLDRPALRALVAMGPSARHSSASIVDSLPEQFTATASVRLGVYPRSTCSQPRGGSW